MAFFLHADALQPARRGLKRFLPDLKEIMRGTAIGLLCGAVGVLSFGFSDRLHGLFDGSMATVAPDVRPASIPEQSVDPRDFELADAELLRKPMRFAARRNGTMLAEGSIDQGAGRRLVNALEASAVPVRRLILNSPGGSLDDAIAMAKILRERGVDTEVPSGALCASSCPLVLAGGLRRFAGAKAAIGVHQFYSVGDRPLDPVQAMSDAQLTTARISRHLSAMGVSPQLWLHALDTPPRALYYFSHRQMSDYRLVTGPAYATALR